MERVTPLVIESLMQQTSEAVLTIYLPTHRQHTSPTMQEDQTRFKNLIRAGRDMWKEQADNKRVDDIFRQLETHLNDLMFWQNTTEALSIFADIDHIEFYHLPIECQERVSVGASYDVTPLLVVTALDQPYYLLALAMHNTKLLRGSIYELEPVEIDFPTSPEDALQIDEMFSASNTVRSPQQGRPGTNDMIRPHGQGDSREAGREERMEYFRIIDSTIANSPLVDQTLPILIAGTDSGAGDYKALTQLSQVMPTFLQGNYTILPLQDLHARSWPLIHHNVEEEMRLKLEQLEELRGAQKSSYDIRDITEAAAAGRVATLFVGIIRTTTDSISNIHGGAVPIITFTDSYDACGVTQLARQVASKGGDVRGVNIELLPKHAVAAMYRY